MRLLFAVVFVFSLLFGLMRGQGSGLNEQQKAFIKEREDIVIELAEYSQGLHSQRVRLVNDCKCSKHGCSNDFMDTPCEHHLGTLPFCKTNGWRIDVQDTIFRTAPGTNPEALSDSLKENICVYKHMVRWAVKYNESDYGWIYIATLDGHFRRYPASARRRGDPEGDPELNDCKRFDPRLRPWFIAASTGPKDIVLVVDRSGSMNDLVGTGKKTKWDLTVEAVESMLDTFSIGDFVNVVTFSDDATPLNPRGLLRGTKDNLTTLKTALRDAYPRGKTNFTAAFTSTFNQLSNYCEGSDACSNCQKIILFLTDGRDTSEPGGESVRPSRMAELIEDLQYNLITQTGQKASIFTYSMSEQADDAIPRQIACSNNGAWAFIGPNTDTLDALNSYYLYIAAGRKNVTPVWVEPFEDSGGLGQITTVAMPFFAHGTHQSDPDVFLGVVGHDVILRELEDSRASDEQVLNEIIERSMRCMPSKSKPCELQVYRNSRDRRAVCAAPYSIEEVGDSGDVMCFNRRGRFYKRSVKEVSWHEAEAKCKQDNGQLISIIDEEELAFVANLASLDGSWIGAQREDAVYVWLDDSIEPIEEDSDYWGVQEPFFRTGTEDCVAIDTRGDTGNLHAKPCEKLLSYICQYDSEAPCSVGVEPMPEDGSQSIPPLNRCLPFLEALDGTKPVKEVSNLSSTDVMCPLGAPNRTSEDVICCDAKEEVTDSMDDGSTVALSESNEVVDVDAAEGLCLSLILLMFSILVSAAHVLFV